MPSDLRIERDPSAILKFSDTIQAEADKEREALGFLPSAAYRERILQGKLILLVASSNDKDEYAGHLLFGGSFPVARIQQTCVSPKYRGTGGASLLLRALISQLERQGYLSVSARVASELQRAMRDTASLQSGGLRAAQQEIEP